MESLSAGRPHSLRVPPVDLLTLCQHSVLISAPVIDPVAGSDQGAPLSLQPLSLPLYCLREAPNKKSMAVLVFRECVLPCCSDV